MMKCLSSILIFFCLTSSAVFAAEGWTFSAENSVFKLNPQDLVPPILAYSNWLGRSSIKWPTAESDLRRMDGAIALELPEITYFLEHFTQFTLADFSAELKDTRETQKIPFALTVNWKTTDGHHGTFQAVGYLEIVENIFSLNLNEPNEYRDRFVSNVHVESISGDNIIFGNGDPQDKAETTKALTGVLAPFIIGKDIVFARIGFNAIERQLKEKLEEELRKIPPETFQKQDL